MCFDYRRPALRASYIRVGCQCRFIVRQSVYPSHGYISETKQDGSVLWNNIGSWHYWFCCRILILPKRTRRDILVSNITWIALRKEAGPPPVQHNGQRLWTIGSERRTAFITLDNTEGEVWLTTAVV